MTKMLTTGRGTCALAASALTAGTADLSSSYAGGGDFAPSYSASNRVRPGDANGRPPAEVSLLTKRRISGS